MPCDGTRHRQSRREIRAGWEHRNSISRKWLGSDPRWRRCPDPAAREPHQSSSATTIAPCASIAAQKSGRVQRRAFDQNPRPLQRRPRLDFPKRFLRQQRVLGAIHEIPGSDQRQRFCSGQPRSRALPAACNNSRIAWRAAFPSAMARRESLGFDSAAGQSLQCASSDREFVPIRRLRLRATSRAAGYRGSVRARVPLPWRTTSRR